MTTPDDGKDRSHRAVAASAERAIGGLVVTRNDQDIITVIHYKLLERDKLFLSLFYFFFFLSARPSSSFSFNFTTKYICNIRNIVVLWDKSLYIFEQLLDQGSAAHVRGGDRRMS